MSKSFLQSHNWAKFQESFGRSVFWVANKLVVKYDLPLGKSWLYCARPDFAKEKTFKTFIKDLAKIAQKENAIFTKIELNDELGIMNYELKKVTRYPSSRTEFTTGQSKLQVTRNLQPQDTLLLDLSQSEKEILNAMHPKTRYNIRLAKKHEIIIKKSSNSDDINVFYNLALKTSKRDNFKYHTREYYKKMLEVLGGNSKLEIQLFIANYKDKPVAAILVAFYKDSAIYLHGASDHHYRKFMSPYLLQWIAIKEAKKRKCLTYDFWGVAPKNVENHTWDGITRFKLGFAPSGKIVHYPQCFDIIYQPTWYYLYKLGKKIRK